MMLLNTTLSTAKILCSVAGTLHVNVNYADFNTSTNVVTVGNQSTAITVDTLTTVCAAPSSGYVRNIKTVYISNEGANATMVTFYVSDGTTDFVSSEMVLQPAETMVLDENGVWHHFDTSGSEYLYQAPALANMGPSGTLAESFPRMFATTNAAVAASGTLMMQAIYLTAGQTVSNITMLSGSTAAATTTNLFFALYDINRVLLAQSANQGAYTWSGNTFKTLAMTASYRIPTSGIYYAGVLQVATTIASLIGTTAKANNVVSGLPPIIHGTSTTGLTTALPNPAAALSATTYSVYVAVS